MLLSVVAALGLTTAAMAQTTPGVSPPTSAPDRPDELSIIARYPSITVNAGDEAVYPLFVESPTDERVDLSVSGVPDGVTASLRGGDAVVSSVFTDAAEPPALELRVRVPADATPGSDELMVSATSPDGQASLPLDLVIADAESGSVSLESKYPVLSGDSEASYSFDLKLANDTAKDLTFGLQGSGPDGWTVDVRPSGEDKAATALVAAGSQTNIKVTADPPRFVPAGRYLIGVTADSDGQVAEAQLGVEITGSHALTLDTPDGRLNDTISAGDSDQLALLVTNTGTAPLSGIELSAKTPKGWQVSFDPASIASLDPSAVAQVQADIAPAGNSVAGDYVLTMTARSADATSDMALRTTVETSAVWGVAAIAVIALAGAGLFLVFRRYGRR
jgi:uncharacterized membrane protein